MTRRYLLDSGPAQDFVLKRRGVAERVEAIRKMGATVGVCTPVLGEVVGGLERSATRGANMVVARRRLGKLTCWPYELPAAWEYGRLVAELLRRGRPMQQIDIQVAAVAIILGDCTVVTRDSDFLAIPGLPVENWSKAT